MEKYNSLLEFIKVDFIKGSILQFMGSDDGGYERYKNEIEPYFDIKISEVVFEKLRGVKFYEIREKNSDKFWHILLSPANVLFAKNMKFFRETLLKKYGIQGIFTLKNAFFKIRAIPASAIVLNKPTGKVWLTSAISNDDIITLFIDISAYKRKVYYTEKLDIENFSPEHYNGVLNQINDELSKYNTKPLADIADLILGKCAGKDDFSESGIKYIRGRNIQQGEIVKVDTYIKDECAEKFSKVLLEEGDILLTKNFGQHKFAKVMEDDLPAIASNGLFIIRAFGVPEGYLYQYLTSETGKDIFTRQLQSIEKGTVVASVNLKDLRELRVPLFKEQTMMDFAQVESVKIDKILSEVVEISRMSRMSAYYDKLNTKSVVSVLEERVYNAFIENGWDSKEVLLEAKSVGIALSGKRCWIPDIVLLNNGALLAVVEVKFNISLLNAAWVTQMREIVHVAQAPFLIITTGNYYEIHSKNSAQTKKMATAPTKDFLLSLLAESEGK